MHDQRVDVAVIENTYTWFAVCLFFWTWVLYFVTQEKHYWSHMTKLDDVSTKMRETMSIKAIAFTCAQVCFQAWVANSVLFTLACASLTLAV